jgi:hypothetical protein
VIFVVPLHILVSQGMHTKIANMFLWLALTMSFTSGLSNGLTQLIALKKTLSVATVMNLAVELSRRVSNLVLYVLSTDSAC